jgi:hypothetical protein
LLNEALGSFLLQTPREGYEYRMLVLNDCPEQRLTCSVPGVEVVNLKDMYRDVSEKFNAGVRMCPPSWVAWWEDDDISLPDRLTYSLAFTEKTECAVYKQGRAWFWEDGRITKRPANLFFGSSLFWRDTWIASPGALPGQPADRTAWESMSGVAAAVDHYPSRRDTHFIYRWSGWHHDSAVRGTNADRFNSFRFAVTRDPRFVRGDIELVPTWRQAYLAIVDEAITTGKGEVL